MRLNDLAKEFGDRMNFLCVYIKEAHPTDGSQSPGNVEEGILFKQPTTADERAEVAAACMLRFNFSFPMVLDDMSNEVVETYLGNPERTFILDANGIVTWRCGLGPHYFDPDGYEAEIRRMVGADEAGQTAAAE